MVMDNGVLMFAKHKNPNALYFCNYFLKIWAVLIIFTAMASCDTKYGHNESVLFV